MRTIDLHTSDGIIIRVPGVGVVDAYATEETPVPADGVSGYAKGCTCRDTINGVLYLNEGDAESADFNAVAMV